MIDRLHISGWQINVFTQGCYWHWNQRHRFLQVALSKSDPVTKDLTKAKIRFFIIFKRHYLLFILLFLSVIIYFKYRIYYYYNIIILVYNFTIILKNYYLFYLVVYYYRDIIIFIIRVKRVLALSSKSYPLFFTG